MAVRRPCARPRPSCRRSRTRSRRRSLEPVVEAIVAARARDALRLRARGADDAGAGDAAPSPGPGASACRATWRPSPWALATCSSARPGPARCPTGVGPLPRGQVGRRARAGGDGRAGGRDVAPWPTSSWSSRPRRWPGTSAAPSVLPMGSLFEGAMFLVFEVLVLQLRDDLGETPDDDASPPHQHGVTRAPGGREPPMPAPARLGRGAGYFTAPAVMPLTM